MLGGEASSSWRRIVDDNEEEFRICEASQAQP